MGATSHFPLLFGLSSPHSSQRCFSAFCLARRAGRDHREGLRDTGALPGAQGAGWPRTRQGPPSSGLSLPCSPPPAVCLPCWVGSPSQHNRLSINVCVKCVQVVACKRLEGTGLGQECWISLPFKGKTPAARGLGMSGPLGPLLPR